MIRALLPPLGTFLLACAVAASVWALVRAWREVESAPAASSLQNTAAERARNALVLPQPRPAVYYAAITERPLFHPTRRPEVAAPPPDAEPEVPVVSEPVAVAETPAAAPAPPALRLIGTMLAGSRSRALIAVEGGNAVWVEQGAAIAGWTLARIGPDWAELALDSQKHRLDIFPQ